MRCIDGYAGPPRRSAMTSLSVVGDLCMRIQLLGSATALTAAAALAVSTGLSISKDGSGLAAALSSPTATIPETGIEPDQAARLAKQASFGPTPELINAIVAKKSASAWLDDQLSLSSSTYSDLMPPVPLAYCSAFTGTTYNDCRGTYFSMAPIQSRFYSNAINKNDQLRQRAAFALSQITATSDSTDTTPPDSPRSMKFYSLMLSVTTETSLRP